MNNVDTIKQTNRKHTSKKKKLEKQISSGSSSENENYKNPTQPEEEPLIGGRFEYKKLLVLGSGTFGEIYIGFDTINKEFVALKIEKLTAKMNQQLKNEKNVIEMMYPTEGFPRVIDYGPYYDSNYLAIDLLGPSLLDMFEYCGYRFTLQTVLLVGYQMIQRIQELHSKNFIHRDIKPENFLIGTGTKSNVVYLVDFGLAHRYKDPKTMEHIIYRETKEMTGTARYASINNLLGVEQSRRDDLEAIGYVLIYFLKRRLPWQGVQGTSMNDKCKKILDKKLAISVENLCKDLPSNYNHYTISRIFNLHFLLP